ncbi:D-ribose ABC transporter substrate-binding protein [Salinisphaera sp. Q1T1-3]|uniref:D-ribose ABC transporter substrate-binding protein n=1 Tax=Salinisphaera sp. Q1T1-3 TaxID=2321229 RepID=UPI000E740F05|nr:D-ribose ABC transporter substrate-binding protein [Salinisphaera sp. Q1T1-3]RJS91866.1 D-ribose ABC transporter substrate-binding protein [Salinisphaera sp. Q1T1-3]
MNNKFSFKRVTLALMTGLCLSLAWCGAAAAADFDPGKHLIAVITPSHSNPFYKTEADTAVAAARKMGYKTSSLVHQGDPDVQLKMIQNAIADNASAIVLDNAGSDASVAAVRRARDAGIPVYLIDREINANGVANAQIVSNNFQCASSVAQHFAKTAGYKGKWVELFGKSSDTNAHVRSQGFHSVMDDIPTMKMVAQQSANWDQTEGYNVMQSIIQAHSDIAGVLAGNDTMALGAAAALKNAGMSNVPVMGIDGNPDVVDQIASGGNIRATGLQQASVMARMAVQQIDGLLRTGKTDKPEKQSVNCVLVTEKNADQVLPGGFGMKKK